MDEVDNIMSSTYRRRYAVEPPQWSTKSDESALDYAKPRDVTCLTKRSNHACGACRRP